MSESTEGSGFSENWLDTDDVVVCCRSLSNI